jgi:hypothetical protein
MEPIGVVAGVVSLAKEVAIGKGDDNLRHTIKELEALHNSFKTVENEEYLSRSNPTNYRQELDYFQSVAKASQRIIDQMGSERGPSTSNKLRNKFLHIKRSEVSDKRRITELSLDITRHLADVSHLLLQKQSCVLAEQEYQCREQERLLSRQRRVIWQLENASFGRES